MQEVILVKLGEIVLKGLNRRTFEDRLLKNIRRRIARAGNFEVYSMQSTIYIEPKDEDADIDEAEERIRRIAAPQNVARHPGFRTPCAKTGVCADCNSQDRICNTRMEMLRCWPDKRVLVILIDEDSGL